MMCKLCYYDKVWHHSVLIWGTEGNNTNAGKPSSKYFSPVSSEILLFREYEFYVIIWIVLVVLGTQKGVCNPK